MELRDYQIKALDVLHREIQEKDILLLQAATGAGKTVTVVKMIEKYFGKHQDRSFLIVMHKQELVSQFLKSFKFTKIPAWEIGIACASYSSKVDVSRRITVASVQTIVNYLNEYPGADLVVIDETHRVDVNDDSQYEILLRTLREYKPEHKVLGITATAMRLGHGYIYGTRCRPGKTNFFPELTHRITYAELLAGGYLMPLKGRIAAAESITEDLKNVSVNGDYNLGQLGTIMAKSVHIQSAVDGLDLYGQNHKSVCVFGCTIEHCESLVVAFKQAGHDAVAIHSKLSPVERTANLEAWQSGVVRIAVSVNILVEGFDFPALSCLIFARPTKSAALFIQAIGRILRKSPGKDEALLIDLTDNTKSFGLNLDEPIFKIPSGGNGGEAPMKVCPGENQDGTVCGQLLHASLMYCPHCGYKFETITVDGNAAGLKEVVFNEPEPVIERKVNSVNYYIHTSRNTGKELIKVTYQYDYISCSEYICLPDYYSGFAVEKARTWWAVRSDEPFPETVEEFMFLSGSLKTPSRIETQDEGKFVRIVSYSFDDKKELDEEENPYFSKNDNSEELIPF